MKRDIEADLLNWKNSKIRMPLLVRGARQVGKTHVVEAFGLKHFENLVSINLEERPEFKNCFNTLNPQNIIAEIEILANASIVPGKSLLFLDEIQECPAAITAFRYFKERMPELHIIGAGSLLEFVLNDEEFRMPVGRVQSLYLKPMSFNEFLEATGRNKLRSYLTQVTLEQPPSEAIHAQALAYVREYLALGGMPAVINAYCQTKSIRDCQTIQTDLLTTYRNDFGKYAKRIQVKYLQKVFQQTPGLIGKELVYSQIDSESPSRDIKIALDKLCDAGLVTRVYATHASEIPLFAGINEKKSKLFFIDVGLVKRAMLLDIEVLLQQDIMLINQGALAEQLVAQELLVYQDRHDVGQLFYWLRNKKGSDAEVDFVVSRGELIVPVEVKSGATGRLKSIRVFMEEKNSPIGVRISQKPLHFEKGLLSLPFYLIAEFSRLVSRSVLF
ncbi:MAG: AAA family ATPase [Myxococcaceae bacterium]